MALDQNEILIAEFNFASESAFQANEDRLKVFNLFIANVGALIAATALPQLTTAFNYGLFSLIFVFLFIAGMIVLLQLAKLRIAWVEAAKAMNQIKDYYIENNPGLEKAFKWRLNNIPKTDKIFTIAFLLGSLTMLINSISLVAFIYLASIELNIFLSLIILPILFAVSFAMQVNIWFRVTRS